MIDKSMPGNGAMTDGVYQGSITDVTQRSFPEIEVEVVEEGGTVVEIDEPVADDHDANLMETVFASEEQKNKINALATEWITEY